MRRLPVDHLKPTLTPVAILRVAVAGLLLNLTDPEPVYVVACCLQAQDGASGVFCQPFTLLATMCVDMPTMTACSSYLALCNTTGSVVRQCAQQQPIPRCASLLSLKGLCVLATDDLQAAGICTGSRLGQGGR